MPDNNKQTNSIQNDKQSQPQPQQLSQADIKLLTASIEKLGATLYKLTDGYVITPLPPGQQTTFQADFQVPKGPLETQKRGEYYDRDNTIQVAGPVDPVNPSSPVYNREEVNVNIGHQNGEYVQVSNRGDDNLFVRVAHIGNEFADETVVLPGQAKIFNNVYELRLRSPTVGLPYTVTEELVCCPTNVSGNIVQVENVSGQALIVSISGATISFSGEIIVDVSGDIVHISGQSVITDSGSVTSVSGDIVTTGSGSATLTISGSITSVSGDIVEINSGLFVSISGQIVGITSGSFISISGQEVEIASGLFISISGQIVGITSGSFVSISGQIVGITSGSFVSISGQAIVTDSGSVTSVSGNIVEINSGLFISISGQIVGITSGSFVSISGQIVGITSGSFVSISGQIVGIHSGSFVSISGQEVEIASGLFVSISGQIVGITSGSFVSISGQIVGITSGSFVSISGQIVGITSGSFISISGQIVGITSGSFVSISGQAVTTAAPSAVINTSANPFAITGASGGVALSSGVIVSVVMKSLTTNSGDIYIGGSAGKPFSGFGFILSQGETLSFDINNFNAIFACAAISGDRITYMGTN